MDSPRKILQNLKIFVLRTQLGSRGFDIYNIQTKVLAGVLVTGGFITNLTVLWEACTSSRLRSAQAVLAFGAHMPFRHVSST